MNWMLFGPELFFFFSAMVLLCMSFLSRQNAQENWVAAMLLSGAGLVVNLGCIMQQGTLFHGVYQADLFSQIFKTALALGLFLIVSLCTELKSIKHNQHPEFYFLLFVCTLAMMMLVSSVHVLTIYLSLELSSYSLYILVAMRRGSRSGFEAGIKYFLIGVFSSAVMIFGVALIYSATKTTFLSDMMHTLPSMMDRPLVVLGVVLTLCGFFFKLGVFPFHFWAPDAYQGAANQVTAYIATVSKIAAIAILLRMVGAVNSQASDLTPILMAVSIVSMTLGNLAAIAQKDIKRLLAYSTIAQGGYVLIGVLCMDAAGYAGAMFYALAWVAMKFTLFMVIVKVAHDGTNLKIAELAGLHRRAPVLALALMVAVFSLAGIPPTVGFTGKLFIFIAAMGKGYFFLVLIAMINVVISLTYYLLILKAAYLDEPEREPAELHVATWVKILAVVFVVIMVVAGIYPHHLVELTSQAVLSLLP